MTQMTHAQRVASARETGIYEPLRKRMQYLLDEGYSYREVASLMFISISKVKVAISTLELQVGRGRHGRELHVEVQRHIDERAAELALVAAIRYHYGVIGRGFSTA